MPSTSPTLVKRRLTPPNLAKPLRIASSVIFSSSATATAASAFWTLCRPGIGSIRSVIVRSTPSRPRISASKRLPPGTGATFSPRTSACALNP